METYQKYILRFPVKFRAELKKKLDYKRVLERHENLHFPAEIWLTYLTPPDPAVKKYLKKSEQPIWRQKEKVLDVFAKRAIFIRGKVIGGISSRVITAILLEILFDLETKKVQLSKDEYIACVDIADQFGLWRLRYYLEDAIFKNFDPENYTLFRSVVEKKIKADKNFIHDTRYIIKKAISDAGIKGFNILNRQKNVYGVYRKMQIKRKNINDIWDIHGFRVLLRSKRDCYRAAVALDRLWPTYKDRFKDYIRKPKENGYQSIHTVMMGLRKTPTEFQIRTFDMDIIAVSGRANHADYKKNSR